MKDEEIEILKAIFKSKDVLIEELIKEIKEPKAKADGHKIIEQEQQIKELKGNRKKLLNDFADWTMENEESPNYITHTEVEHYLNKQ